MVRPEKCDPLHLVFHFTISLSKHGLNFYYLNILITKCIFRRKRNDRKVLSS